MVRMRDLVAVVLLFSAVPSVVHATERIGVVLLHGKHSPANQLAIYDKAMADAGVLFARPEMCWSRNRIYDKAYLDCISEVDAAIAELKTRGAAAIVIGGMSLGANGVLGYAARHRGLMGVIAIAPAHYPEFISRRPEVATSIERARTMISNARGDQKATFADVNNGRIFEVRTTARIYLSFLAPDSPAVMPGNAARLTAPLLQISGTADPTQRGKGYIFGRAPANPMNRYVAVKADHIGTMTAGREAVIDWLRELAKR